MQGRQNGRQWLHMGHERWVIGYNNWIDLMASSYKRPSFSEPADNALSVCAQGSFRLLDFQWRFAVTTKHSLLSSTDCLIQLKLVLGSRTTEQRRVVHLELSMGQFNQFYREMQKISNTLSIIN